MLLMKLNGKMQSRKLAFSGILTAMTVIALYLESIVPTGRAGFFVLTSFFLCAVLLETSMKWAFSAYVASAALSFLLVPDKLGLLPFLFFFGIYPMIKNWIERLKKLWLEWLLKVSGFSLLLLLGFQMFQKLLPTVILKGYGLWLAVLVLELGFVLYDYLCTRWIHFYFERIAHHIRKT